MEHATENLSETSVHLWTVCSDAVADPDLLDRYRQLMSDDERERHQRFRFEKDRNQFAVARALVRTVLSRYAPVPPDQWCFEYNDYGKPHIAAAHDVPLIRFNLSHTDGLIACAVTRGRDVGVDVETINPDIELSIAANYFAADEVAQLEAVPEIDRPVRFFEFWTLKEAYIKARGLGLSLPLADFSFHLDRSEPPRISFTSRIDDEPTRWQFLQPMVSPSHRTALAVAAPKGTTPDLVVRNVLPLAQSA